MIHILAEQKIGKFGDNCFLYKTLLSTFIYGGRDRINFPHCNNEYCAQPIQRTDGCNHMTCSRCRYEFCWTCLGQHRRPNGNGLGFDLCDSFHCSVLPYRSVG